MSSTGTGASGLSEVSEEYPYLEDVNEGVVRNLGEAGDAVQGSRVLDVGCGYGRLGWELRRKGYEVWGIEQHPATSRRAEQRLDKVITADLQSKSAVCRELGSTTFDYLVFSDVLEHLADPLSTLRAYLPFLSPNGQVIVSVPNVANWQTRFSLAAGRFHYQDTGVLDRTHLRFFTRSSAVELVRQAGLEVERVDVTPLIVRAVLPLVKRVLHRGDRAAPDPSEIVDSKLYRYYMEWVYPGEYLLARALPGLLSFRVIVVARPR